MGDAQGAAGVLLIGGHHGDHLAQGLLHGERLAPLTDLALRGGAHEQLDLQRVRHNGLEPGEPAVLAQVVQILQDKEGLHLVDIAGGPADYRFEVLAGRGQLLNLQRGEHLAGGGGAGVEDMHAGLRVLLQVHGPGLGGAVVGAGEQGGEGDHIDVVRAALHGIQILSGRGTGGGGGLLALLHPPEEGRLVEGGVVGHHGVPHPDGEGDADKTAASEHGGRQVTAAVHDNFKTHIINLQM